MKLSNYNESVNDLKKNLIKIYQNFSPTIYASSLAAEDMVITDLILINKIPIQIFTLDTGRLHNETIEMIELIKKKYDYEIIICKPDLKKINNFVNIYGLNAFYKSISLRKECCNIRKVEPLNFVLKDYYSWITGQRREQSESRREIQLKEYDETKKIFKFNPIFNWSDNFVWNYLNKNNVPYNSLYKKGFSSIGCKPCTRPIIKGEEKRAGRWWWENNETKECGLHSNNI